VQDAKARVVDRVLPMSREFPAAPIESLAGLHKGRVAKKYISILSVVASHAQGKRRWRPLPSRHH
jgi:hypothetical protein